jgi:hypothetical protein
VAAYTNSSANRRLSTYFSYRGGCVYWRALLIHRFFNLIHIESIDQGDDSWRLKSIYCV